MREVPPEFKLRLLQADAEFLAQLHADKVIEPARTDYASWHERRAEFDQLWDAGFTNRYEMRFSEIAPLRMFSAMFLHGSAGHLIGNMIFLALLGLLVEAALGPWLFLALYLAGGIGAQLVSLAWRWGEHGNALNDARAAVVRAEAFGSQCIVVAIDAKRTDGSWDENLATGTGFPRVFYLNYHLYKDYFPLLALSTFVKARAANA